MIERRPLTTTADKPTASSTNGSGQAAEVTINSPLPDRLAEIERRVSAAFSSDMTSSALANLCQQLGYAVVAADEFAKAEAERALDPTTQTSLSARESRQVAEDAVFQANRLKTMQPRLAAHFEKVYAAEKVQTYLAKLRELAPEHGALQQELRATYEAATGKLIDLFTRVRDFEQRARQELGNPPANCAVLERIDMRAVDKVVLPDWQNPDRNLWPPRSNSGDFAATFAASMIVPSAGPYWSDEQVRTRIAAEQQQQREKMAAHYEQAAREQEARENRLLAENWKASQRRG